MRRAGTFAVVTLVLLTGCGGTDAAGGSQSATGDAVTVDVTIADGGIEPVGDKVEVGVGQPVTLRVDSDAEETLHVHSDPEHEYAIEPGTKTYTFTVDVPGQVAVEAHDLDETVVTLVVR